ncbi:MAG: hypothetical protein CMO55_04880 [Verrucomicrobiales bacterium]|nr:hypothetical protein [Verrucomicrobiales bacterium]
MKFAVIGLGYFGASLCRELAESGHEVIAVDNDSTHLKDLQELSVLAVEADGTELEALEQIGVGQVDTAIVAIGEAFEASLVITAHCQDLGVKNVYTRVINDVHARLLDLMKVSGKIRAETMAAAYFSRQLSNEAVRRYFGLDAEHGIVEMAVPDFMVGQTVEEAKLRKKYRLNLITIRKAPRSEEESEIPEKGSKVVGTPGPDTLLKEGDYLIVFGKLTDIDHLCQG